MQVAPHQDSREKPIGRITRSVALSPILFLTKWVKTYSAGADEYEAAMGQGESIIPYQNPDENVALNSRRQHV
jgi:hypothetical protein